MSYCVNRGVEYEKPSGLCPACHFDQHIPEGIVDAELSASGKNTQEPMFRYPGERAALVLSIVVALVVAVILGAVSLGLFVGVLIISLFQLKLQHVKSQKNMIRVSQRDFQTVFRLGKLAAYRLKLPVPEIYVTQSPTYNAFTLGFYRYGFVVLHSELIRDFDPRELLFVIGHEIGHIKRFHTTWLTLLNPAASGGGRLFIAPLLRPIFNIWSVKAEYTADQGGLIVCGDVEAACRAFMKLAGGKGTERELDLEAIRRKQDDGDLLSSLTEYLSDHPFFYNRMRHVVHYAVSPEFQRACWWARA